MVEVLWEDPGGACKVGETSGSNMPSSPSFCSTRYSSIKASASGSGPVGSSAGTPSAAPSAAASTSATSASSAPSAWGAASATASAAISPSASIASSKLSSSSSSSSSTGGRLSERNSLTGWFGATGMSAPSTPEPGFTVRVRGSVRTRMVGSSRRRAAWAALAAFITPM